MPSTNGHLVPDDSDDGDALTVAAAVRQAFDGAADVTVRQYTDHLDVHVLPTGVKRQLEAQFPNVEVVPYTGFKLTVQGEDVDALVEEQDES